MLLSSLIYWKNKKLKENQGHNSPAWVEVRENLHQKWLVKDEMTFLQGTLLPSYRMEFTLSMKVTPNTKITHSDNEILNLSIFLFSYL